MFKGIKLTISSCNKSMLQIHSAVLLFGLAGLFGKLIKLSALVIVFGRVLFAAIFLYAALRLVKADIKLKDKSDYKSMVLLGIVLTFHWVAFFLSIQLSTVAIGLLTFSTFPVFVVFLEPVFFKSSLRFKDIIIALIAFSGVILVIPKLQLGDSMTQGALWGIFSGLSFAVLSLLNKKHVKKYSGLLIAFYQDCAAAIVLLPFVICIKPVFTLKDISLLVLLGALFTGVSHALFISSLVKIRAQTASIIACLEPLYGVIAAALIIGELPSMRVVAGGIIILGAAVYTSISSNSKACC